MAIADLFNKKPVPGSPEKITGDRFDAEVLSASGTVVVDLWASWCGPCQVLGGLLEEVGPQLAGRVRIVKVNVEESPEIAARFGIRSIPTLLAFKDGRVVDRQVGLLPLNPLKQWLERHAG